MVNIKDVARAANVSASTVSHVINNTRHVAPQTRENVENAIATLGYRPSTLARALKSKSSRSMGMLVTTNSNPFFAEVVRGVEEGCYLNDYSLILCNSNNQKDRQLSNLATLVHKRIDALVVMTSNADPDFYEELRKLPHIPKVVLDSEPDVDACTVGDDSIHGGRLATEHLIKCGFTEIGCLTGPKDHPRSRDRYKGFEIAMREAGLTINPDWIVSENLTTHGGYRSTLRILDGSTQPQAIFAFNDLMAMGAYRAILQHGLAIPDDISIIGYDDLEFAAYLSPPLTTVNQPSFDLGLKAAAILIDHIENNEALPSKIQLTPELVVRKSVKNKG